MAETGIAQTSDSPAELSLDPFSFQPGVRSKVAGLGGTEQGHDRDYVFHTEYVPVAEGHAHFHVRLRGLTGKLGTFVLRVHMFQRDATEVRLVTSARVLLSRMVLLGGNYDVKFEAFHGVRYALYCGIQGDTDAAADSLEIVLDRPAGADEGPQVATEARNSAYGRDAVKPSTHIISIDRATLELPVSQLCTGPQLRERAFHTWSKRLPSTDATPLERWGAAYVLQVLGCYGMLAAGARGLGVGAGGSPVADLVAEAEASVVVLGRREDAAAADAGWQVSGTDADASHRNVSYRDAEHGQIPRDLVNFDFLWTDRIVSRAGSVAEGINLAQKAMTSLRPGGLAVHLIDFALTRESRDEVAGIAAFARTDLDRLALLLISRGHEVAQIKVDAHKPPTLERSADRVVTGITLCGLVARKALTVE